MWLCMAVKVKVRKSKLIVKVKVWLCKQVKSQSYDLQVKIKNFDFDWQSFFKTLFFSLYLSESRLIFCAGFEFSIIFLTFLSFLLEKCLKLLAYRVSIDPWPSLFKRHFLEYSKVALNSSSALQVEFIK